MNHGEVLGAQYLRCRLCCRTLRCLYCQVSVANTDKQGGRISSIWAVTSHGQTVEVDHRPTGSDRLNCFPCEYFPQATLKLCAPLGFLVRPWSRRIQHLKVSQIHTLFTKLTLQPYHKHSPPCPPRVPRLRPRSRPRLPRYVQPHLPSYTELVHTDFAAENQGRR